VRDPKCGGLDEIAPELFGVGDVFAVNRSWVTVSRDWVCRAGSRWGIMTFPDAGAVYFGRASDLGAQPHEAASVDLVYVDKVYVDLVDVDDLPVDR
jgi:hypothetical protein